jgi:hypothetical protein
MTGSLSRYHDWMVNAALLPVLLTLAGIAVTTVITWPNQALWNPATLGALRTDSHADDYVQGLAERGIVQLPGYHRPPALPKDEPLLSGHELRPAVDLVSHR